MVPSKPGVIIRTVRDRGSVGERNAPPQGGQPLQEGGSWHYLWHGEGVGDACRPRARAAAWSRGEAVFVRGEGGMGGACLPQGRRLLWGGAGCYFFCRVLVGHTCHAQGRQRTAANIRRLKPKLKAGPRTALCTGFCLKQVPVPLCAQALV